MLIDSEGLGRNLCILKVSFRREGLKLHNPNMEQFTFVMFVLIG